MPTANAADWPPAPATLPLPIYGVKSWLQRQVNSPHRKRKATSVPGLYSGGFPKARSMLLMPNQVGKNDMRAFNLIECQLLAKNRFAVIELDKTLGDAGTKRLLTHHRDVKKRAFPLRYVLTRCCNHEAATEVSPGADAWEDIAPESASVLMRSKTITFHPRVLLARSDIESLGKALGGQWAVMVKRSDQPPLR